VPTTTREAGLQFVKSCIREVSIVHGEVWCGRSWLLAGADAAVVVINLDRQEAPGTHLQMNDELFQDIL
jgi:hypothetical protein